MQPCAPHRGGRSECQPSRRYQVRVATAVSAAHGEEALRSGYRQAPTNQKLLRALGYEPDLGDFPAPEASSDKPHPRRSSSRVGNHESALGAVGRSFALAAQWPRTCDGLRARRSTPDPRHPCTIGRPISGDPTTTNTPAAFRPRSRIDTLLASESGGEGGVVHPEERLVSRARPERCPRPPWLNSNSRSMVSVVRRGCRGTTLRGAAGGTSLARWSSGGRSGGGGRCCCRWCRTA